MVTCVNRPVRLALLIVATGTALAACGGSSSHSTSTTSAAAPAAPSAPSATTPATAAAPVAPPAGVSPGGRKVAVCPTVAQANSALGTGYANLLRSPVDSIGTVCEYTGGAALNAGVTIFPHQAAVVFPGQVANAGRAPGMRPITGVGDGGFGLTAGGRSIVNAYSNASRTFVAAQSSQPLSATEQLARVALAAN